MCEDVDRSLTGGNCSIAGKNILGWYHPGRSDGHWGECKGSNSNTVVKDKVMYGSWMDYVSDWEQVKKRNPDLPVLTLFYEDLKQDQMRGMRRMCEFLGVERTDDFLSRICDNTTLTAMRTLKINAFYDGAVFRKGGVGDWKNWFTVAQNEWFDQLYQENMADCHLQFKYTL